MLSPSLDRVSEGPAPVARGRSLVLLVFLAGAVLTFLATLPWQMRQWQETGRLRQETAQQEVRLQALQRQKEKDAAAERRLTESPTSPDALLEAAQTSIARGDVARALPLLRQMEALAQSNPTLRDDPNLMAALSGLYERMGWQDRALTLAQRAVQLAPKSPETLMRLAYLESALGWQTSAQRHGEIASGLAPNAAEPRLILALLGDQGGNRKEAENQLMAAHRVRPGDWHILLLLAQNRMNQRRFDQALATLEAALAHAPTEPALLATRANALLQRADQRGRDRQDLQAALETARQYQRLAPDSQEAHFLMGQVLRGLGDIPGAIREWQLVYAVRPDFPSLRINLGQLLARQGERERGRQLIAEGEAERSQATEFNRLVTKAGMNRDDPESHRALARWAQTHGQLPRAILEWEQVLRIRPEDTEAKRERENCLALREQMVLKPRSPLTPAASSGNDL